MVPVTPQTRPRIPLWRDERFLRVFGQVVFIIILTILLGFLARNMLNSLHQKGLALGFSFLRLTAGFDIGEHLISYDRSSTYLRAFGVGLLNTALVSFLGIFFATILGVILGVSRLARNFLIRSAARIYIELLRNIPLLGLLFFWYTGIFIKLPRVREATPFLGSFLFTNKGVAVPWGLPTETFPAFMGVLAFGAVLALGAGYGLALYGRRTGHRPLVSLWSILTFLGIAILGWFFLPAPALILDLPIVQGLGIVGGRQLSPEFMALLSGLVIYTSAFIADVVRAGIQSVQRGQIDASRALGLSNLQMLRLVVFPQALRVIIPPLTGHYLNLAKNSSLAVAIGYPDLFSVSGTILNQSGRAVEVITLVMAIYLAISLLTSLFMNWYNRKIRFVER
jgi:general L-amino acid transport system permease protein